MKTSDKNEREQISIIDPFYRDGFFYLKSSGHQDAKFKVEQLEKLLRKNDALLPRFRLIADIGCGSGKTTFLLKESTNIFSSSDLFIHGYDIHPYMNELKETDHVRFIFGDFREVEHDIYDLAVTFDVVEHVPDPLGFLRSIAQSTHFIALHIPLDNSILSWLRGHPKKKLSNPGHLLNLDVPAALNLLSFAGLKVIDFDYSPVFKAPSGKSTLLQKFINPLRWLLYKLNPYICQKLLGGVSLIVLTKSPYFLEN